MPAYMAGEALAEAVRLYDIWSKYEPESEGILIAYASIHGGTAAAAERFGEILREKGAKKVVVSDLSRSDMAEVIEDAFRYPKRMRSAILPLWWPPRAMMPVCSP